MMKENTNLSCIPGEVALKSFFLGPQSENAEWVEAEILKIFRQWFDWRRRAFPQDGRAISIEDQNLPEFIERRKSTDILMQQLLKRFEAELPKFSPRYIGHMFSETSIPALFGHIITLLHNPNNISGEASRVGTAVEEEALQLLGKMFGFSETVYGHFTSGGTIANFEALSRALYRTDLWLLIGLVARELGIESMSLMSASQMGWAKAQQLLADSRLSQRVSELRQSWGSPFFRAELINKIWGISYQGPVILVPEHKHYSWEKGVSLMGLGDEGFWAIGLNKNGVIDDKDLQSKISLARQKNRPVAMLVSVVGTTELGFVDPLHQTVQALENLRTLESFHIWHHVDAAYGGFFVTMKQSDLLAESLQKALAAISKSDSITVDPHKLGYVPYSSGTIVISRSEDYYVRAHLAPYLQYATRADRGPYTIEGSRSAAGAVATWLSAQSIGLEENGYGRILHRTIQGKRSLEHYLEQNLGSISLAPYTELNVLGFVVGGKGDLLSEVQKKTHHLYEQISAQPQKDFFISKTTLRKKSYGNYLNAWAEKMGWAGEVEDLELIRICIMNPFFSSQVMEADFPKLFVDFIQKRQL